jgi:hypothetical protein
MRLRLFNVSLGTLLVITTFSLIIFTLLEPKHDGMASAPLTSATMQLAPTVAFCELVRNPTRFDKKIVRTQAIFYVDAESQALYDPTCDDENTATWVDHDASYIYSDEAVIKTLKDILCQTRPCTIGKAYITVVGRFEGPNDTGYGHLNGYRFRFAMMRIEKAESVLDAASR